MLACLQRSQTHATQHLMGAGTKMPDLPVPSHRKSESSPYTGPHHQGFTCEMSPVFTHSPRYPSPAELDAYARKTADSPLSIKIFPTNIRVPQHKQVSRTVNGLDTMGQRYSPYAQPYSGGYQGLLAVVRTSVVAAVASSGAGAKSVLKTVEGKRAKLSPAHIAVAPYAPPASSSSMLATRLRHKGYSMGHSKPVEMANMAAVPNVIMAAPDMPVPVSIPVPGSGGQCLPIAPQSETRVPGLLRGMVRPTRASHHLQTLQSLGETRTSSPSLQVAAATTACSDSGFATAPPHSGLAYSGAVLPIQSADTAPATGGQYMDGVGFALWQKQQQQQQQQHYQQQQLRMYGANSGGGAVVSRSPETCVSQFTFRGGGTGGCGGMVGGGSLERVGASPMHCPAMHGEFSVSQFFAPPWNTVLATPDSDCYTSSIELPLGSSMGRDMGLHHHPHNHHHPAAKPQGLVQHYPAATATDRVGTVASLGMCCGGPPSRNLCHASVLSSSLQSLECLISEIHPPCIKERMLGRGYEAVTVAGGSISMVTAGTTGLADQQPAHIQLPVFR